MKKKVKYLFMSLLSLTLLFSGCGKDKNNVDDGYKSVESTSALSYLEQVEENRGFDIEGYELRTEMSMMNITCIYNGQAKNIDNIEMKVEMNCNGDSLNMYIKDNNIYYNDGTNKYYTSYSDVIYQNNFENIVSKEDLNETIENIKNNISNLNVSVKEEGENLTYHYKGKISLGSEANAQTVVGTDSEIDVYLTFKDYKLVEYTANMNILFMSLKQTIRASSLDITFPSFDDYVELTNSEFEQNTNH